MYTRGKQKGIQRTDEETTDNQEGSVGQSFVLLLVLNFSTFYLGGDSFFIQKLSYLWQFVKDQRIGHN